jgi:sugar/nucleoside kinase (ribokinase family)
MQNVKKTVAVAGHICLDIIPTLGHRELGLETMLQPGKLSSVGPAVISTGGAVSNTGIALHRLGINAKLMGKIGDDRFGSLILDVLNDQDPSLTDRMIISKGEESSYTVVISPPGIDRIFLHCSGTNDTFTANDVKEPDLEGCGLFHFGYPPLMKKMYEDGGVELVRLFQNVKKKGLVTSLDMTMVDPDSDAGKQDWKSLLRNVLPHIDLFSPSFEEIVFMLDKNRNEGLGQKGSSTSSIDVADGALLHEISEKLLAMGTSIVCIKLGDQGLYMRTSSHMDRIQKVGGIEPELAEQWVDRELLSPCYKVDVVGTTGAGDCTIAGFLTGWIKELGPEEVMTAAAAVGSFNVEHADSTSGVPPWSVVQDRMSTGRERIPVSLSLPNWQWNEKHQLWRGPHDQKNSRRL